MNTTLHRCLKCNEPMSPYVVIIQVPFSAHTEIGLNVSSHRSFPVNQELGYICMKEGCERYGLLAVTAKTEYIQEG